MKTCQSGPWINAIWTVLSLRGAAQTYMSIQSDDTGQKQNERLAYLLLLLTQSIKPKATNIFDWIKRRERDYLYIQRSDMG